MEKIGIFTPTPMEMSICVDYIVTLHYFRYAKNFRFSGEKHDFWEIAYVDRGEVGVVAEGKGFDLKQGEAIFHKPNEYHNIWTKDQYANVVIVSFVCHSEGMAFLENKIITFDEQHQAILGKILKEGELCFEDPLDDVHQTKLQLSDTAPYGSVQVIKNYIELLLLLLIQSESAVAREGRASARTKMQGDNKIAEAVKQILDDNIYGTITLDDILQRVCFSKTYLTRLFRRCTGTSIMGYYMDRKIAEAQRLISERDLSFTQIADKLGFHSIHHFSNTFKKHTGMTPSEYRKSIQSMDVL